MRTPCLSLDIPHNHPIRMAPVRSSPHISTQTTPSNEAQWLLNHHRDLCWMLANRIEDAAEGYDTLTPTQVHILLWDPATGHINQDYQRVIEAAVIGSLNSEPFLTFMTHIPACVIVQRLRMHA